MKRKTLYFGIVIAALAIIAFGFLLNIKPIVVTLGVMKGMADEWQIWAFAIVSAFVLSKCKYYWLTQLGCACVASALYQIVIFTSLVKVDLYTLCVRAFLFLCIVFVIDYLRLIFKR